MRQVLTALCVVAAAVGCSSGTLAPPSDGSADRRDATEVAVTDARDAGPDVRDGSADGDAPGDAADAPGDTSDAPADNRDGAVDLPPDAVDGTGASDAGDGGASDAPTEAGRPYVERACGSTDACVCASNEDCSFTCPGGGCAITCMTGSNCTVACASPFGCSVSCGHDAQCILACNLGVCAHFFGPASTLACDPAGLGCI